MHHATERSSFSVDRSFSWRDQDACRWKAEIGLCVPASSTKKKNVKKKNLHKNVTVAKNGKRLPVFVSSPHDPHDHGSISVEVEETWKEF